MHGDARAAANPSLRGTRIRKDRPGTATRNVPAVRGSDLLEKSRCFCAGAQCPRSRTMRGRTAPRFSHAGRAHTPDGATKNQRASSSCFLNHCPCILPIQGFLIDTVLLIRRRTSFSDTETKELSIVGMRIGPGGGQASIASSETATGYPLTIRVRVQRDDRLPVYAKLSSRKTRHCLRRMTRERCVRELQRSRHVYGATSRLCTGGCIHAILHVHHHLHADIADRGM